MTEPVNSGRRPRVCIIGAGLSGLVSAKKLSDYGIPWDCFEIGHHIGGNWSFENSNGLSSAYRSLHIDTSKERLRFKDFAISRDFPDYPHHSQVKEYLDDYCAAFDLKRHISFGTKVEGCERLSGGGWKVRTDSRGTRLYDVVVVANGHLWDPHVPGFPGTFDGPSIHSHHYVDPADPIDVRGKRVLVVGIGNSAADIASEIAQKSNNTTVFLSTRSGAYVLPKYFAGRPLDQVVRTIPWLPLAPQRKFMEIMGRWLWGHNDRYGLPRPNHKFYRAHPTISSELLLRLGSGDITAKGDIAAMEGDRVRFVDGSIELIDVIIYATGYNMSFPFFAPELVSAPRNSIGLYKRMFKPGLDDVVFIGFAQPLPTAFPFVEFQAGVLARYLAGIYRPPSEAEMTAAITADDRRFTERFTPSPRHTQEVDYYVYEREMRTRELPAGRRRVARLGAVPLAGRAAASSEVAA